MRPNSHVCKEPKGGHSGWTVTEENVEQDGVREGGVTRSAPLAWEVKITLEILQRRKADEELPGEGGEWG